MRVRSETVAIIAACAIIPPAVVAQPSIPNCIIDEIETACSHRIPPDDEGCPDTIQTNGDCHKTLFYTFGHSSSTPYSQDCEYYVSIPTPGGCETDTTTLLTYTAHCLQATGSTCGSATVPN